MIKKLLLLFILFCTPIQTKIVEHADIKSVFNYIIKPDTLVIFDIDNTLATTEYEIGNDQWFNYLVTQKIAEGLQLESAINLALPTYFHVAFQIPLIPVQNSTPKVIQKLNCKKIPTLGLTARSIYIADRTIEQLDSIGIRLSIPQVKQHELFLTMPSHIPSMYKQGILFSGSNDKGEVLLEFFKETGYHPSSVIFVDDKEKYLKSVQKALDKKSLSFVGIRYSYCDEQVKNFNPIKADYQLAQFRAGVLPKKNPDFFYSYIYNVVHLFLEIIMI